MNDDRQDEIDDLQVELAKTRANEAHWRKVATAALCELTGHADPDLNKAYELCEKHRKAKLGVLFEAAQKATAFSMLQTDADWHQKELARLKSVNAELRQKFDDSVEEIKDLVAKHNDKVSSLNARHRVELDLARMKGADEVIQLAKERGELDELLLRVAHMMDNRGE